MDIDAVVMINIIAKVKEMKSVSCVTVVRQRDSSMTDDIVDMCSDSCDLMTEVCHTLIPVVES